MAEIRIACPSSLLISGPSGCGKTWRVFSLLRYAHIMLQDPDYANRVIFYYKKWQPLYEQNKRLVQHWVNQVPTLTDIEERCQLYGKGKGCIVIVDDFGYDLEDDFGEFFSVLTHHELILGVVIQQNLFPRQKYARQLSLNAHYVLNFKNPRDTNCFAIFARQIESGKRAKALVEAFREATNKPHGYLLLNFRHDADDNCRYLSQLFPDEDGPVRVHVI